MDSLTFLTAASILKWREESMTHSQFSEIWKVTPPQELSIFQDGGDVNFLTLGLGVISEIPDPGNSLSYQFPWGCQPPFLGLNIDRCINCVRFSMNLINKFLYL